jgi:hypothetical protein
MHSSIVQMRVGENNTYILHCVHRRGWWNICVCDTAGYGLFTREYRRHTSFVCLASYVGVRRPTRSVVGISYL